MHCYRTARQRETTQCLHWRNAKLLLQKFPQSATDFVLQIVRRSDRKHLFVRKENKVSGILRELLKQKLSALYASSAVRVCQLLCTAPLETFQTQTIFDTDDRWIPVFRDISGTVVWLCGLSSWLNTKSLTLSQRFLQCGHKLMVKVNKQKNSDRENLIYGERLAILNTENIKICGRITKL